MTDYERELLTCLAEECAELQKAAYKALRHGLASYNPDEIDGDSNRQEIEHEAGDVMALIDMLIGNNTLTHETIKRWRDSKPMRMQPYLHFAGARRSR